MFHLVEMAQIVPTCQFHFEDITVNHMVNWWPSGVFSFNSFPGSPCLQVIVLWVFHTLQPSWIFLYPQLPKSTSREQAYLRHLILCCSSGSFGSRNGSEDECAMLGLASFPSLLGMGTKGVVSPESRVQ